MNYAFGFFVVALALSPSVYGARSLQATAAAPAPSSGGLTNLPCPIANGTLRVGVWAQAELPVLKVTATAPFTVSAASTDASGFEAAIIQALSLFVNCKAVTVVPLPDLPSRITALQNGQVDLVISSFSYTAAREKLIDFVRPFYYGAGAALYTTAANAVPLTSWSAIKGTTICTKTGNYAIPTLTGTYGATTVDVTSTDDAIAKIKAGTCTSYLQDSTVVVAGLSQVKALKPILVTPYGIGVQQNNDVLLAALTAFSVALEIAGDSPAVLTEFENTYLVPSGVGPLATLNSTINAITNFA